MPSYNSNWCQEREHHRIRSSVLACFEKTIYCPILQIWLIDSRSLRRSRIRCAYCFVDPLEICEIWKIYLTIEACSWNENDPKSETSNASKLLGWNQLKYFSLFYRAFGNALIRQCTKRMQKTVINLLIQSLVDVKYNDVLDRQYCLGARGVGHPDTIRNWGLRVSFLWGIWWESFFTENFCLDLEWPRIFTIPSTENLGLPKINYCWPQNQGEEANDTTEMPCQECEKNVKRFDIWLIWLPTLVNIIFYQRVVLATQYPLNTFFRQFYDATA